MLERRIDVGTSNDEHDGEPQEASVDAYFSADVETDGPIPGPFSILSFALVYAGSFDGTRFERPREYSRSLYKELRPISENFEPEALRVNGLDRGRLCSEGESPDRAMTEASDWVRENAGRARPVLVAYPLSFDWTWLYWYFVRYSTNGSPFDYSRCFDVKTALAVKARIPISEAGRSSLADALRGKRVHTHHALDDAIEQAEIFANIFEWEGVSGRTRSSPL
ncbi:MAG: 3'-5' exoribonuclease [Bryobacteraceae bacterium]